eukprot:2017401-Prymnesium_polylepis.2
MGCGPTSVARTEAYRRATPLGRRGRRSAGVSFCVSFFAIVSIAPLSSAVPACAWAACKQCGDRGCRLHAHARVRQAGGDLYFEWPTVK